jgi:hypothetical protein
LSFFAACASCQTGSFAIPVLDKVDPSFPKTQALVLVPTRELALQTSSVLKKLSKHFPTLNIVVSTGGTDLKDDIIRLMKPVHILVATPGRILDLCNKRVADLSACNLFVMDEADKLLSPEFVPLIDRLLSYTPASRQILCFSATFPITVKDFAQRWLHDVYEINLMEELTLKGITQYYAFVEEKQKVQCLNTLFSKLNINQAIIFANSVNRVELLAKKVTELGSSCFPESDTRVLTNMGFLFVGEIEAHVAAGREVLYACFDANSEQLEYCRGELVFPDEAPARFVEFTDANTKAHWSSSSDEFGRTVADVGPAQHVSLRVTPDHQMYVQVGNRVGAAQDTLALVKSGGVALPPSKIAAVELTPSYKCECTGECLHGRTEMRFLASAAEGMKVTDPVRLVGGPLGALGLSTTAQLDAFLELYGYWLGDGSLSYDTPTSRSTDAVILVSVKDADYLQRLCTASGLENGRDWHIGEELKDRTRRLLITKPSWFALFDEEYWVKYTEGRRRRFTEVDASASSAPLSVTGVDASWAGAAYFGAAALAKVHALQARGVKAPNVKSAKWFWWWVLRGLVKQQARLVLAGLHVADGHSKQSAVQKAQGRGEAGSNRIYTSSVSFREEITQLMLHAGYTTHFAVNTHAGPTQSWNAVPKDGHMYSAAERQAALEADPSREFKQIVLTCTSWYVAFGKGKTQPNVAVNDVVYEGGRQAPPEKKKALGWTAQHTDGTIIVQDTIAALSKLIDASESAIKKNVPRGYRTRSGWLVTKNAAAVTTAAPAAAAAVNRSPPYDPARDGRVWCVSVQHPNRLIVAQRAFRNVDGVVTKASRPVIVGNCFYIHAQMKQDHRNRVFHDFRSGAWSGHRPHTCTESTFAFCCCQVRWMRMIAAGAAGTANVRKGTQRVGGI